MKRTYKCFIQPFLAKYLNEKLQNANFHAIFHSRLALKFSLMKKIFI